MGKGSFEGDMCQPIVMYLRISAFRTVCLLPLADVTTKGTLWTMHLPPQGLTRQQCSLLAKLLRTLVYCYYTTVFPPMCIALKTACLLQNYYIFMIRHAMLLLFLIG